MGLVSFLFRMTCVGRKGHAFPTGESRIDDPSPSQLQRHPVITPEYNQVRSAQLLYFGNKYRPPREGIVRGADFCGLIKQPGCSASPRVCCSGCVSEFTHNCAEFHFSLLSGLFFPFFLSFFHSDLWISLRLHGLPENNPISTGCLWHHFCSMRC